MPLALRLSVGLLLLAGCHSAHVPADVTSNLGGNDPDVQLNFWHTLAEHHLTSNQDAFHAILLYVDDHDDCADYNARVALLKSRGMLAKDFNEPHDSAVKRGTVAVMFVKILNIHGGWALHLFVSTIPRYATRELIYLAIFPYCSPQQTFSGTEFVGVIGALEDYQTKTANTHPSQSNTYHAT
jgi:hypothetical protein